MSEAKVALVTGSSSGIGRATAKILSQKGYRVVVVGSKSEKVNQVAEECDLASSNGHKSLKLVLNFDNPENGELAVKETIGHFGRLDVLVNNAGIFTKTSASDPATYDIYRQLMTINTDSTVKCTLAAIEHLRKAKGTIVFVSSVASIKPSPVGYAYCMSKASMSSFAKCLAIDVAPDIRVNIVSPGPVSTPIFERIGLKDEQVRKMMAATTLQGRVGESDEIANAVAFLISDEARFVNGHEMFIDGGYLIKPTFQPSILRPE